jgi:hypothetical protein
MTDADDRTDLPMVKRVHCHRTGRDFELDVHKGCPYCYGDEDEIATGEHGKFCDFKPGVDPVSFGFPTDDSRHARG